MWWETILTGLKACECRQGKCAHPPMHVKVHIWRRALTWISYFTGMTWMFIRDPFKKWFNFHILCFQMKGRLVLDSTFFPPGYLTQMLSWFITQYCISFVAVRRGPSGRQAVGVHSGLQITMQGWGNGKIHLQVHLSHWIDAWNWYACRCATCWNVMLFLNWC